MATMTGRWVPVLILLGTLAVGCATGMSKEVRSQVTYDGPFAVLQKAPRAYAGQVVMLGGRILEVTSANSASEMTVLQMPLGSGDRPEDSDQSQGRFLVRSRQLLDPSLYQQGRLVTVVGTLVGSETRPIGEFDYVYPALEAREIKIWEERGSGAFPNVFFNIGVGAVF